MFTPSMRFWLVVCGVLFSILVESVEVSAESSLRPSAQPGPEDEAAIVYDFLRNAIDHPELESLPPEEFSLGAFITVHLASDAFWQATATGDPFDEIVPSGEWVVPVLHEGDVVAAAVMAGGGSYIVSSTEDQDFGEALTNMTPTDKLLYVMENSAWYVVTADTVTAFNDDGAHFLPNPVPLAQFQQMLHEQWLVASNDPPGYLRGGGRPAASQVDRVPRQVGDGWLSGSRMLLPGAVGIAIGALIAVLMARRRVNP